MNYWSKFILSTGAILTAAAVAYTSVTSSNSKTPEWSIDFTPTAVELEPETTRVPRIKQTYGKQFFRLATHNPERAYPGYNLVPVSGSSEVLLVDMRGEIQHRWPVDALRARLLPDGNLMTLHGSKFGAEQPVWRDLLNRVREFSWDGQFAWGIKLTDGIAHHDLQRLENGNTLFLREFELSATKATGWGRRSSPYHINGDSIVEVDSSGKIVWEWFAHDHFDLDYCGWKGCPANWPLPLKGKDKTRYRDWTHINTISVLPPNKHFDSGDTRFTPGNLLIIPRSFWTAYIIDRSSGEIVWSYEGNHGGSLEKLEDGMVRGHEAHLIPKNLPGAGNILLYDNGLQNVRRYSIIREIDPLSGKSVWEYEDGPNFFSHGAGLAQRLPNGNTLISVDRGRGRLFEVTPDKEVVWDLRFKFTALPARAHRYELDHCPQLKALAAKTAAG